MASNHYSARRVILTSLAVDFVDLFTNFIVLIFTGSAVFLAETLQGASDIAAVFLVMFGVNRSKRKRDKFHQFGHGREMYFWTLIASIVILLGSGIPSIFFGYQRLINPHTIENIQLAYAIATLAIFTNGYAFRLSSSRLIEGHNLRELPMVFLRSPRVETKTTFTLDFIGASAALTSLTSLVIFGLTGNLIFDAIGAIIIGLILVTMSLLLILGIGDMIIGRSVPTPTLNKIRKEIKSHKEIKKILDLRSMYIGPDTILIEAKVFLERTLKTKQIEKLIDTLQGSITDQFPKVRYIQIEVETPELEKKEKKIESPPKDY